MKYRKWMGIAGVAIIALLGAANAWADDAADCQRLVFGSKQYEAAAPTCKRAAEHGDATGQYTLGSLYYTGRGVQQDYTEAGKWFRKAAEQGDADAQFFLGVQYSNGLGVQQDYTEAAMWMRKAAEQGHAHAQFGLGVQYNNGLGVQKDYTEAAMWMRKAAEQGDADAQLNLAAMYANGEGVMTSGAAAADWYYKAGVNYLKEGKRDDALNCVERIKNLQSHLHLTVPNAFLADKLLNQIYGGLK